MSRATSAVITVVGSLNVDLIADVQRLPRPGETVVAPRLTRRFGGKGANQALAAVRQGARVTMIGCVGDDPEGRTYMDQLRRESITVSTMKTARGTSTGTAFIAVDATAENQIIVHPGANGELTAAAVRNQRARIAVASALLVQFEIPLEAVLAAIEIANGSSIPVVLNPSPANPEFPWGTPRIDVLIVNQPEAEALFGLPVDTLETDFKAWDAAIAAKKIRTLIVTRGARSTLTLHHDEFAAVPCHPVEPVDTVGAGDTFAGAFTAQHYSGKPFLEAVHWANVAGALATLKAGAQEGIPMAGDITQALNPHAMD
jgi:ribokinase